MQRFFGGDGLSVDDEGAVQHFAAGPPHPPADHPDRALRRLQAGATHQRRRQRHVLSHARPAQLYPFSAVSRRFVVTGITGTTGVFVLVFGWVGGGMFCFY